MKESRRCIRSNTYPEVDRKVTKYAKKMGCKHPSSLSYFGDTGRDEFITHMCFDFASMLKDDLDKKYVYVTHFLLSEKECYGESPVLCVLTEEIRDEYSHRFFGTHNVGECPFCEYREG
jgi:hypothetical protein